MRAWTLCYFHGLIFTRPNLLEGVDHDGGQMRGDRVPFNGVTSDGRVWRMVPESEAWSVGKTVYPTKKCPREPA